MLLFLTILKLIIKICEFVQNSQYVYSCPDNNLDPDNGRRNGNIRHVFSNLQKPWFPMERRAKVDILLHHSAAYTVSRLY